MKDYSPFGMMMPGRQYPQTSSGYRYGFNGKENDNEVKGEGNQQDYGERIYDPRGGRFLSVDPLTKSYPMLTPYQYASNSPIWMIDLDGLEGITFSDVWHGRATIIDWVNDPSTWVKGAQNTNKTINPLYQAYEHGYEIKTGKDAQTGQYKGRGRAVADAGVNVIGWLTLNRFTKAISVSAPLETQMAQNAKAMGQPAKTATQKSAIDATEANTKNTVAKPIEVVNKTPQSGPEFGSQSFTLTNGNINLNRRAVTNGTFDFVVTNDGQLIIGSGHYNLSGGAETVKAAGQISLYKGKVTNISNGSGHYQPSIEQAKEFGNILKDAGVNVSGAKLNIYDKAGKKTETIRL